MNTKKIIISVFIWMSAVQFCPYAAGQRQRGLLEVYLPRQIKISGETITIADVSVISGDESMASAAGKIVLGRFAKPGQQIVIEASTVLSRLASSNISADKVKLTGSEKVVVSQQQIVVEGNKFVESARIFLLNGNRITDSVCKFELVRTADKLVIPAEYRDIKLVAGPVVKRAGNQYGVQVTVLADGQQIARREVKFSAQYECHRTVAVVDIEQGQPIKADNVRIEKYLSGRPESKGWSKPYGMMAKRRIKAGNVIRPGTIEPKQKQVVIKRNQAVVIRIDRPELVLTVTGKAMQDGRMGDVIRVRNVDSKRIIVVRVCDDGAVEPVFSGKNR